MSAISTGPRREVPGRNTSTAKAVASGLAQAGISPNQISGASIFFSFLSFVTYCGILPVPHWVLLVAAGVFIELRLICNLLDGMVAVEYGKGTPYGFIWNDAPDRISDCLTIVGAGLYAGDERWGWLAALGAVLTAYVRVLGASSPPHAQTFGGPMGKPYRMQLLVASGLVEALLGRRVGIIAASLRIIFFGSIATCVYRLQFTHRSIAAYVEERAKSAPSAAVPGHSAEATVSSASSVTAAPAPSPAPSSAPPAHAPASFEAMETISHLAELDRYVVWLLGGFVLAAFFAASGIFEGTAEVVVENVAAPSTTYSRAVILIILFLLSVATFIVYVVRAHDESKTGNELRSRTLTWWVIILSFLACYWFSTGGMLFYFGLVSYLALKEYLSIVPSRRSDRRVLLWMYLSLPIQFALIAWRMIGVALVFLPVFGFLLLATRSVFLDQPQGFIRSVSSAYWGLMLCGYSVSSVAMIAVLPSECAPEGGLGLVIMLVVLTELNDVAQFCWGKSLGRYFPRKILPVVSPNKTVVGLVGGVVTSMVVSCVMSSYLTYFGPVRGALIGGVLAFAGFAGDVSMSSVKRDLQLKDTGTALPGHGGFLDRLDSLTFTAPIFFHFVRYFYVN